MVESLEYLDFSKEELLKEYYWISYWSKGGYIFNEVANMPFGDYEIILKEAMRIDRASRESIKDNDNL